MLDHVVRAAPGIPYIGKYLLALDLSAISKVPRHSLAMSRRSDLPLMPLEVAAARTGVLRAILAKYVEIYRTQEGTGSKRGNNSAVCALWSGQVT